jgi:hypothetical protein
VLKEIYLEITQKEYDEINRNKYHPINYIGIGKLETINKNDRFYLLINNYVEIYPNKLYVNKNMIEQRINSFVYNLQNKKIRPSIITICRSRFSGYTPFEQWEFIENILINELNKLYRLSFIYT